MILTELRKAIDKVFKTKNFMDATVYSQGYINGVKDAPKYGILNSADWHKLGKYIQVCGKKKMELQCSTKKIMDRIKRENIG